MQIPVIIEPGEGGGFRARAGEPFSASADGPTPSEAVGHLAASLRERLKTGRLGLINLTNGPQVLVQAPLQLEPLPDEDWFFQTMGEAISENRQREDEANR